MEESSFLWSKEVFSVRDIVEKYPQHKVILVCEGWSGVDNVDSFSAGEIYHVCGVQRQRRVICVDIERNGHCLSIPINCPIEFFLKDNTRVHEGPEVPLSLEDIVKDHLCDDGSFSPNLRISMNRLQQISRRLSNMKVYREMVGLPYADFILHHVYDELYLLVRAMVEGKIQPIIFGYDQQSQGPFLNSQKGALAMPVYLQTSLRVSVGLEEYSDEAYRCRVQSLDRAVWDWNNDHAELNEDILLYHKRDDEKDYEYLAPTDELMNMIKCKRQQATDRQMNSDILRKSGTSRKGGACNNEEDSEYEYVDPGTASDYQLLSVPANKLNGCRHSHGDVPWNVKFNPPSPPTMSRYPSQCHVIKVPFCKVYWKTIDISDLRDKNGNVTVCKGGSDCKQKFCTLRRSRSMEEIHTIKRIQLVSKPVQEPDDEGPPQAHNSPRQPSPEPYPRTQPRPKDPKYENSWKPPKEPPDRSSSASRLSRPPIPPRTPPPRRRSPLAHAQGSNESSFTSHGGLAPPIPPKGNTLPYPPKGPPIPPRSHAFTEGSQQEETRRTPWPPPPSFTFSTPLSSDFEDYECLEHIPDDICCLTTQQLASCLRALSLDGYASQFIKNRIDGALLKSVPSREELCRMMRESFGMCHLDSHKLWQFVNENWRPK